MGCVLTNGLGSPSEPETSDRSAWLPQPPKKRLNRASNARLSFSPHNVGRRRMASAAGEPLRQSHTTERDNECDDAPRRRAAPFDGHDPMAAGPAAAYTGQQL